MPQILCDKNEQSYDCLNFCSTLKMIFFSHNSWNSQLQCYINDKNVRLVSMVLCFFTYVPHFIKFSKIQVQRIGRYRMKWTIWVIWWPNNFENSSFSLVSVMHATDLIVVCNDLLLIFLLHWISLQTCKMWYSHFKKPQIIIISLLMWVSI